MRYSKYFQRVLMMKFCIKFNGRDFTVEAESAVHAVIKLIDTGFGITDKMEFQVTRNNE